MKLDGVSALVTGGTSGLGAATVRALEARGVTVVTLSRRGQTPVAAGDGVIHCVGDVCDEGEVTRAVEVAASAAPLRAAVFCAGGGTYRRTLDRREGPHSLELLRDSLEMNAVGAFNCARIVAARMATNQPDVGGARGAIVVTSSLAAVAGQVGQVAYAAGKAALEGMVLPLARDLAPLGIRLNAIRPGGFDTPIFAPSVVEKVREKVATMTAFPHRLGDPAEFASLAIELLTNDYLNAATVQLDGGMRHLPR